MANSGANSYSKPIRLTSIRGNINRRILCGRFQCKSRILIDSIGILIPEIHPTLSNEKKESEIVSSLTAGIYNLVFLKFSIGSTARIIVSGKNDIDSISDYC